MSVADRLDRVRRDAPGAAVQPCAGADGTLCVVVARRDRPWEGRPGVQVEVSGPTPGSAATDDCGVAEFRGRAPGEYRFRITLPGADRTAWKVADHAPDVGVAAGEVAIAHAAVYPTGRLVVEIRTESGDLLREPVQVLVAGTSTLEAQTSSGLHVFPEAACGPHDVSARVPSRFTVPIVTAPTVVVPEGGSVTARLVVQERTWVEIELLDEAGKGVAGEEYLVVTPEGREVRGRTDARGCARVEGIAAGRCRIAFPRLDREAWRPS